MGRKKLIMAALWTETCLTSLRRMRKAHPARLPR